MRISVRSIVAGLQAPRTIHTLLCIAYYKHSLCTCHIEILADDEVAETLLEIPVG